MIVGNTGSGKTTLLQQLMKYKRTELGSPKATVGIDVKDWIIQGKGKMKKELILNVWDFGGISRAYCSLLLSFLMYYLFLQLACEVSNCGQ